MSSSLLESGKRGSFEGEERERERERNEERDRKGGRERYLIARSAVATERERKEASKGDFPSVWLKYTAPPVGHLDMEIDKEREKEREKVRNRESDRDHQIFVSVQWFKK